MTPYLVVLFIQTPSCTDGLQRRGTFIFIEYHQVVGLAFYSLRGRKMIVFYGWCKYFRGCPLGALVIKWLGGFFMVAETGYP